MKKVILLVSAMAIVSIAGCKVLSQRGSQNTPSEIFGPYSATGTIVGTGSSLYRRGTHVLKMDGRSRFYLESKSIDLNDFVDGLAVVRGEMMSNTHAKFFPVIEVESVQKLESEGEDDSDQEYVVSSLRLSIAAPRSWKNEIQGSRFVFSLASENAPFITIEKSSQMKLPEGLPVRIDGFHGSRIIEEVSDTHRIYVERRDGTITLFTFGPKGDESQMLRNAFYSLLRTVKFDEGEAMNPVEGGDAGNAKKSSLQPCGGPAAVLCPENEYCKVTEMSTGIGECRVIE